MGKNFNSGKTVGRMRVDDGFQFQIVEPRTYKRKKAIWALSNAKTQEIIRSVFPSMTTSKAQRKAAARWAAVIHLYFVMGYTRSQVATEIGSTTAKIHGVIRSVNRAVKGLRADGGGPKKAQGMPQNDV